MNKTKKLTSLLCALTFVVSSFISMPVMAEETEAESEFDGTYLSIDFEIINI